MDLQILQWINNNLHGVDWLNQTIKCITYLGEKGIIWLVLGLVLLCFKKTRKGAIVMLASLILGGALNSLIIKPIVARTRPFVEEAELAEYITSIGMSLPDSYSFASGHALTSFACATSLTICFGGKGAWSYILASLIALSRIFLCVHYPSDVLAGVFFGVCVGIICTYLGLHVIRKIQELYYKQKSARESLPEPENYNG
jgi:undecaprenyl-diphosphatase